jgi:type II secretory pathway pseudopilin PulG
MMKTRDRLRVPADHVSIAGDSLIELLVVLAVTGMLALGTPRVLTWSAGLEVSLAAAEIEGALQQARSSAIRLGRNVAVRFHVDADNRMSFTLYEDGDGDGVRNRDIEKGVDRRISPPRDLRHFGLRVKVGFPAGVRPRDPGDSRRWLDGLHDPIRFNRSDLASFGPLGQSTPGSVYVTDGRYHLLAVRVYGRTGKVKIVRYDPASETWR